MTRPRTAVGRASSFMLHHLADPGFYADRYRTSRSAEETTIPPKEADRPSWSMEWLPRRIVFTPLAVVGLIIVSATVGRPRTPSADFWLPATGVFILWLGVVGALAYAEGRWPRGGLVVGAISALIFLSFGVAGVAMFTRAIGNPLLMCSIFGLLSVVQRLWSAHRQAAGPAWSRGPSAPIDDSKGVEPKPS